MWKTMWINVKNFSGIKAILTKQQVGKLFLTFSTIFPQFYAIFSQGLSVKDPHINNPYYYYLLNKLEIKLQGAK
jgi:hypothetical protein